jgi:glycosyltransferase involved in cell wall biosynthesis
MRELLAVSNETALNLTNCLWPETRVEKLVTGSERLTITFVCPADSLSGGMRVIALYAAQLARRGHKVIAALPRPTAPSFRARIRGFVKRAPDPLSNTLSFFKNVPFVVHWLDHAGPITDRDLPDADVVIATWWETAEWVWKLSASKGAKLHFMQDYEVWGPPENTPRVDAVSALPIPKIVIARWVWELVERRWGQTPIALVPNSVETEKFFAPPRGKQPTPTVGLTYSSLPNKGSDVSFAAIEMARHDVHDLRVIAFGAAPPNVLPDGTEFHVQVPDEQLRDLYAACDAWLFGTRKEGFGLPILEAMACRTPVIGTPAGAAQQLIGQGGGILVPIEDVSAMARAIVGLAKMKDIQWRELSDAAYRTATTYTWEDATHRFEEAIKSVARKSSAPSKLINS